MNLLPPQNSPAIRSPGLLGSAARTATLAGAVGSVVFTLLAGRHNPSWLLPGLFVGWVLMPFIAYALAARHSGRWPRAVRIALHALALIVALGSLPVYGTMALGPARPKPAAVFLLVPPGSVLLASVVVSFVALVSSRRAGRKGKT